MVSVPIKYSPKDKKAPALLVDLAGRKFSLYPNRLNYLDAADWDTVKNMARFKQQVESGELFLFDEKAAQPLETVKEIEISQPMEPVKQIIKPDRLSPKKE